MRFGPRVRVRGSRCAVVQLQMYTAEKDVITSKNSSHSCFASEETHFSAYRWRSAVLNICCWLSVGESVLLADIFVASTEFAAVTWRVFWRVHLSYNASTEVEICSNQEGFPTEGKAAAQRHGNDFALLCTHREGFLSCCRWDVATACSSDRRNLSANPLILLHCRC